MKKLIMIILALTLAMGIVWVPSVAAAEPVPITIIKTIPAGGPLEAFTFEAYRDINNNGIIDGGDFLVGQTVIYGAGTGVINSTVKGPMIIHEVLIPGSAYQQLPDQIVQVSCAVEVVFNNGLGEIQPDTITTITASEIKVESGDSVDLTVTEQNTGDDPLTNPYVEVWKDGTLIATLISPPDSGDNANGILDLGETWSWTINSGAITATTTFVALGFGTDSLGNEVSYAQGYEGERDTVTVDTIGPDTITTITASEIKVESGDSVDLTVTEQNTGDDPLTNPYVEVWKDGTLIATLISPPDSGDNANGILDLGETWSWTINSGPITATTTFVALGFGTDSLGNEVSYAEGYEGEWDEVRIDIECTGCLKICKYEDKNGNGQKDDGEPWLSGWVFNVTDSKGNSWSVTTDATDGSWFRADGRNCCPGCTSCETPCLYLPPGEYTITEIPKDGWTCTTDNPLTVTVGCDKETKVDFGNQQECTGCLKIYKYNDKNGDGNWNHSWYYYEPYLSGWEFTVTDAAGNSWSGTTNRRGYVKICDLVPGQYTVTEVIPLPDGWRNTDPGDGSYQKTVTVECDKTSMVKFGNQGPCFGCLNIYKY
jgi:hypothetical protein